MSESSSLKRSLQPSVLTNYSSAEIETEELDVHSESAETFDSTLTEQSLLQTNVTDVNENNQTTVSGCKPSTKNGSQPEYPLTKWHKREIAAKIRKERDRKFENIKKINETIARGASAIKNHSGKKRDSDQLENLKKLHNNQLYHDNSSTYIDGSQTTSLSMKIEALELNLKKIQNELIMEKNKLDGDNAKERSKIVEDDKNHTNNESDQNAIIDTNDELLVKKTETAFCDDTKYVDICSSNERVFETTVLNVETRLTFSPNPVEFRVKSWNSNSIMQYSIMEQQIKVCNRSKTTVLCLYSHFVDPNSVLEDDTNIIKVKPAGWCRVQQGMTVVYTVTSEPTALPDWKTYPSLYGVKLVFVTASNNRPDSKHVLNIPVEFSATKPEPELVTKTITFPIVQDSSEVQNCKKYLIVKNNGDADCVFSILEEPGYQKTQHNTNCSNYSDYVLNETEMVVEDDNIIPSTIVDYVIKNMFSYFIWRNHTNVLLPAKKSVKVPVMFNRHMACSSVTERYTIAFDNTAEYTIPNQTVNVIGRIADQHIIVDPSVIDVGLCYLAGSEHTVSFHLRNTSRVVVPYEIRLPRELSKHAGLSHSKGYLKAGSSVEVFIRLRLKNDILLADERNKYLDVTSGVLDFPVRVYPSNSKKCHEVRVTALVTTSFGLKLTPDTLDFGTVNTTETVVRSVVLANHSKTTAEYGFLKLPERVSVRPRAFGTIFSGEQICLHLHYSPSASDLPQNVHAHNDDFVLTCSTVTGVNAELCHFQNDAQIDESINEHMSSTILNQNPAVDVNKIKELNHGPDEIQVSILKEEVDVYSLSESAFLNEPTVRCHAKIHDVPVELSVQKIVLGKTHLTSYSVFKIDLRASNLASSTERNINSLPDFKVRFEFVSNDSAVEFKPRNGILHSKEVITISVIYRPKFDNELQSIYEECLNSKAIKTEADRVLGDANSFINQVYTNKPAFLHEKIKIFEASKTFYSLLTFDITKVISAVCFVQFVNQKSKEYFGFSTESLKLTVVCPSTKPNIILFTSRIDFGRRTANVRHNEWLFVRNATTRPVPLKISMPSPVGPFFCAFALNGEQLLYPDRTLPINISFVPEHEKAVNEMLEVSSETMRLQVMVSGSGIGPSCTITPEDVFNVIHTTRRLANKALVFRVTNTSGTSVRFNVQMEWSRERSEPMSDDEAYAFVETLRAADRADAKRRAATVSRFEGPESEWIAGPAAGARDGAAAAFDLGNGGRPLWFRLDPNGSRYVQVTLTLRPRRNRLPAAAEDGGGEDEDEDGGGGGGGEEEAFKSPDGEDGGLLQGAEPGRDHADHADHADHGVVFRRRVYAAKFNVHVGHSVLRRFYVFGFVDVDNST